MKASRLLLHQASRPSLQSLAVGGRSRNACGAVFYSNHLVQASSSPHPSSLDPTWLARQTSARSHNAVLGASQADRVSNRRSLLLSESPGNGGAPNTPHEHSKGISDHEYQTRVGKACRVIVDSLPDFMHKGVVDLKDLKPECASSSSRAQSGWSAKKLLPTLSPFLGQSLLRRSAWGSKGKAKSTDNDLAATEFDSLYHPSIAFEFRPPVPHLGIGKSDDTSATASTPKSVGKLSNVSESRDSTSLDVLDEHSRGGPTIYFNGRTMYVASSHLLRHALSALFHDTSLHLESARFEGRSKAGSSWPGISPYIRRSTPHRATSTDTPSDAQWHDKLVVRLRFEGISRVTSHPHTYTVIFKYEFDRSTGMIARHVVDNIQPVPGSKVWAGLTNAWGTLSPCGAAGGGAGGGGGTPACSASKDGVVPEASCPRS
ncbi:uncharacterized protein SRS1_14374 [Sporisorium reilianum f. sp. reilianum]|uniref:Uncharacterized protein n=1 Tax=Sporisorium reilianum f. sp. reilianum TaxID=72559 RepID=A0A2N8UFV9_9BASI|nr:uncharacterized protein SRS1_14374 [Sporisorium reilianum f. sp. reilianum]